MRQDKSVAMKLRLSGQSYNQIGIKLGLSKSTLSGWFSGLPLSHKARKKIERRGYKKAIKALVRRNKNQTILAVQRAQTIQKEGSKFIGQLSPRDLLVIGAALYWAEGYKRLIVRNGKERTHHVVSLTNSDPLLVKIFIKFLIKICKVPRSKILISLRLFEHQHEEALKAYWQSITGISKTNFRKTYRGISISSQRKRPFTRLPYGTVQILVQKTELFHRIMGYIEGIKKNI